MNCHTEFSCTKERPVIIISFTDKKIITVVTPRNLQNHSHRLHGGDWGVWLPHRRLIMTNFFATTQWARFCVSASCSTLMHATSSTYTCWLYTVPSNWPIDVNFAWFILLFVAVVLHVLLSSQV